jgi:ATP-dependent RNA/DNA helicase IGHMBP2
VNVFFFAQFLLLLLLFKKIFFSSSYYLSVQILGWSSGHLYGGRLRADPSVMHHTLKDLPNVSIDEENNVPFLLIDTAGCSLLESVAEDQLSKSNEGEAEIVIAHVKVLIEAGLAPQDIGIITPYNLQVELLRSKLSKYSGLEVHSVDGFQVFFLKKKLINLFIL